MKLVMTKSGKMTVFFVMKIEKTGFSPVLMTKK